MFINVRGLVLEISANEEGGSLITSKQNSGENQRWSIEYSDKEVAIKTEGMNEDFGWHIGRPFYILTKMPSGRAISVQGGRNLVLATKQYKEVSQQFYFDNESKTIKSMQFKNKSWDIQNAGKSNNL